MRKKRRCTKSVQIASEGLVYKHTYMSSWDVYSTIMYNLIVQRKAPETLIYKGFGRFFLFSMHSKKALYNIAY